jgi:hypothetical protein
MLRPGSSNNFLQSLFYLAETYYNMQSRLALITTTLLSAGMVMSNPSPSKSLDPKTEPVALVARSSWTMQAWAIPDCNQERENQQTTGSFPANGNFMDENSQIVLFNGNGAFFLSLFAETNQLGNELEADDDICEEGSFASWSISEAETDQDGKVKRLVSSGNF